MRTRAGLALALAAAIISGFSVYVNSYGHLPAMPRLEQRDVNRPRAAAAAVGQPVPEGLLRLVGPAAGQFLAPYAGELFR
jgi:hypothetical protein